ncbi:hypothetical protein F66182_7883 [Fusarium sp. NRRL 66182]|nr:hypothetical protein F66182_7883 [Fusarium sp. NRRL 66182]
MLLAWPSDQFFFRYDNSCLVRVDINKTTSYGPNTKPLRFEPWGGEFWFRYEGQWVAFKRVGKQNKEPVFVKEIKDVSIRCYGWSTSILRALMDESREEDLENLCGKTLIFEGREKRWVWSMTRSNRDSSTVLHDSQAQAALFGDIDRFLEPSTRKWYTDRGIPYRRGYLLHGPSGTGKSSLSFSIAGNFRLDL